MNILDRTPQNDLKAFQLLSEVAEHQQISQRELAKRLGIAVGLVNSYLKNLISKGFVRVKSFPSNRYAYLLTPQGVAEKSRLAYQHVNYFTSLYTVTRQEYLQLFRRLALMNIAAVSFCGVDEVAEIAWLSLQETDLKLDAVYDDQNAGTDFIGRTVLPLGAISHPHPDQIIITSLKKADSLQSRLLTLGIKPAAIIRPGAGGGISEPAGERT